MADTVGVSATNNSSILNVTFDIAAAGDAGGGSGRFRQQDRRYRRLPTSPTAPVVDATTAISITAANTSSINATAGSGAGSGSVTVGAGVGYNDISNTVLAFADESNLTASDPA